VLKGIKTITKIDVRQRGGGLREDSSLSSTEEATRCYDLGFNDGTPYPGTACFFVEVPVEIFDGAGGSLKTNEVREIVEKHIALGVYPVIHTYGIDPKITNVVIGDGSVALTWTHADIDVSYKVFYSAVRDGEWTQANSTPQNEDPAGNTYTVTGLENGVVYYLYVVGGKIVDGTWVGYCAQVVSPAADSVDTEHSLEFISATPGLPRPSSHFSQTFEVIP